jgi:endonuclease YncB( thermonuclease family)
MRRISLISLTLLLALVAAAPAAARPPSSGRCSPGSPARCHFWYGKVTAVNDGDTFDVNIDGDGTQRGFTTRITGINTTEETRYSNVPSERRGECTAVQATAQVDKLLRASHKRVRLAAQNPGSRASYRLLRQASMRINGKWVDLGKWQLERGLALPFLDMKEWAWNYGYSRVAEQAAARGVGLFNPAQCGRGPSWGVPFKVWVNWDSKSTGAPDFGREWVRVKNLDPTRTVSLAGWWVRSASQRRFHFPSGTTLGPGRTVTVYTVSGTNSFDTFFWGLTNNTFPNATYDAHQVGAGAYLFDPKSDLRAFLLYPCRTMCSDPLAGKISLFADAGRGGEYVSVRNTSADPLDLEGYEITTQYRYYPFPPDSVIQPGETMRVYVNGSPANDTRLVKRWGLSGNVLRLTNGVVRVKTFSDIVVGCYAFDGGSCP